jgi:hypothetical protein
VDGRRSAVPARVGAWHSRRVDEPIIESLDVQGARLTYDRRGFVRTPLVGPVDDRRLADVHMPYRPNLVLAERLGLEVVDLAGDHVGYAMHPEEFASQLGALLSGAGTVTSGR